jgi:hypothetical protein
VCRSSPSYVQCILLYFTVRSKGVGGGPYPNHPPSGDSVQAHFDVFRAQVDEAAECECVVYVWGRVCVGVVCDSCVLACQYVCVSVHVVLIS